MNTKEEALRWYLKGAKDADETSGTNHIQHDFETHFHLQYKESSRKSIEEDFKKFQSGEEFYKSIYELKNPPTHMDKEIITLLDSYRFFLLENSTS